MGRAELDFPIVSVSRTSLQSYGGNQMLSDDAAIRKCGCGIVAAADLFIYLHRYFFNISLSIFEQIPKEGTVPLELYNRLLKELNRRFFPIIPRLGVNNLVLVGGINLLLLRCGSPLRARWSLTKARRWERIEDMLERNLPVIFTVGQNFPFFWQKHRLRLYTALPDGRKYPSSSVKAHYMTATGIDKDWLTVSSWGRKYYVNRSEYELFSRKYSSSVICSIVYIK